MSEDLAIKTAKGTTAIGVQTTVNALLGLLLFMMFARFVTKTEMGVYGGLMLIFGILGMLGILGMDLAVSRYIPYLHGKNKENLISTVLKKTLLVTLTSSLILCLFTVYFSNQLSFLLFSTKVYSWLVVITAVATLTSTIGLYFIGALQGFQKYGNLAVFRILSQIFRFGVTVWLLILGFGVAAIFLGWISFYILFTVLAFVVIFKTIKNINPQNINTSMEQETVDLKSLLGFSFPMLIYSITLYLSNSIDQYVVLGFLGTKPMGVYTVVITAASSILTIIGIPLISTLIPSMSETYGKGGTEKVSTAIQLSTRYISMFFIPACVLLAVLSPIVLYILAGKAYIEASLPLFIVSLGLCTYGFSITLISAITALGKTVKVALAVLLAAIVELVFAVLLVPLLAVVGAALSRTFMYTSMLILLFFLGHKLIKISIDKQTLWKSTIASTVMAIVLYPVALSTNYSLILTPVYSIIAGTVYLTILLNLKTLKMEDLEFTAKILPKGQKILPHIKQTIQKHKTLNNLLT